MPTADHLIDLIRPDFDALNDLLISQLGSDIDLIEQVSQYLIQSGGKTDSATRDFNDGTRTQHPK